MYFLFVFHHRHPTQPDGAQKLRRKFWGNSARKWTKRNVQNENVGCWWCSSSVDIRKFNGQQSSPFRSSEDIFHSYFAMCWLLTSMSIIGICHCGWKESRAGAKKHERHRRHLVVAQIKQKRKNRNQIQKCQINLFRLFDSVNVIGARARKQQPPPSANFRHRTE